MKEILFAIVLAAIIGFVTMCNGQDQIDPSSGSRSPVAEAVPRPPMEAVEIPRVEASDAPGPVVWFGPE